MSDQFWRFWDDRTPSGQVSLSELVEAEGFAFICDVAPGMRSDAVLGQPLSATAALCEPHPTNFAIACVADSLVHAHNVSRVIALYVNPARCLHEQAMILSRWLLVISRRQGRGLSSAELAAASERS